MVVLVDLSGIIFVVLALAWAVYLVPKALQHHDEVHRSRSVDRFSNAMRVLARREPVDRRRARLVVTPARSTSRMLVPTRRTEPTVAAQPQQPVAVTRSSVAARREAARLAARRRRRVLGLLLVANATVVTLVALAVVPWWSVAVPATLTLLFLVACRRQVRRENDLVWAPQVDEVPVEPTAPAVEERRDLAPRRAIRVDAPARAGCEDEFSSDEDTVQISVAELQTVAVPVETSDGGSLWDPLPVTLPTYVTKARASRSVRTIDLGAPGTWTSGRDEADTALVEQTQAADGDTGIEPARAVGG